ncbi:MAG: aconitate hydratase AcnA [Armatimonadetes bacterium]|nr:aconitate hydratase AcnA [Armatimonadota bacterium]MDW8122717.1 aconitate hydratase AcnA [Armatimonadota bacterium]
MTQTPNGTSKRTLSIDGKSYLLYDLRSLESWGLGKIDRLPYSIRILVENVLRQYEQGLVSKDLVASVVSWKPVPEPVEVPLMPARVLLQDFTGVPCVVDLAAMRSAVQRLGGDPERVNPLIPCDLVIDHSVQVDSFGTVNSFFFNVSKEYERNAERYSLLRWAQGAFRNFQVVPPGKGIVHQVNLEYLAKVVCLKEEGATSVAFPDTVLGTDSHTTMINGLGVLGWGVGGIEAEAVMLGLPYPLPLPPVVGVRLVGQWREGVTATDLVLTVTQLLRKRGVVSCFVEFFGPSLSLLSLPDRATVANMAPEYGATCGYFPVDDETLAYLQLTGRDPFLIRLVRDYCQTQGLFYNPNQEPEYSDVLEVDLSKLETTLAGPRRPHERVLLKDVKEQFLSTLTDLLAPKKNPGSHRLPQESQEKTDLHRLETESSGPSPLTVVKEKESDEVWIDWDGQKGCLRHGSVVIAAITSCTNTSNPSVMLAAGLLAKKAVQKGLTVKPWVKTSLAPGSPVVMDYLAEAGLLPYLEALRFHLVGFGCTTCIGNSGPLPEPVARAIQENNLVAVAVLSGNRNFEARIHRQVRANYLASPPLVVAYALAGRIDIDFYTEPLGHSPDGTPVFLRDIWPTTEEINEAMAQAVRPESFQIRYAQIFEGDEHWKNLAVPSGSLFHWDPSSTYIQEPPFFENFTLEPDEPKDIEGARVLVLLGDTITTDHISPAGSIPPDAPAGRYLISKGVNPLDFNTYGARRGNHEVMIRGTFANVRLRNRLVPDREGGWTVHFPTGEVVTIYEAAQRYQQESTPLLVIAGKEYGSGSSRDWAAKGTALLGVRAVLAESFERIHKSNLIGMGVLPLQFVPGQNAASLGLTGEEIYDIKGIADRLAPGHEIRIYARSSSGVKCFPVLVRLDTPMELEYYRHGGILPFVLRKMLRQ